MASSSSSNEGGAAVTEPPSEPRPAAPANPQPARLVPVLIPLVAVALAFGLVVLFATNWNWWIGRSIKQTTDNAYLQADLTPLAARVSGYVHEVPVSDFQTVTAGTLIARIDDKDYVAQVKQAEANVEGAIASIANLESQKTLQATLIRQAEATIEVTQSDLWRYQRDAERSQILLKRDTVSQQAADQTMNSYRRTAATLDLNKAQLEQQRQQLKVLDTQEQQARATLDAQKAALEAARINLGFTRIITPIAGMVGQRQVRPGQYVGIGAQIISIVPLPHIWVVANYKETQLTRVRIGQPATVTVDAFPGTVLKGRVDGWSPASGSQFSLLPPDNATGNFTKVVQRVPVKITLDTDTAIASLLRPGMSVITTIDTSDMTPAPHGRSANEAAGK